MLKDNTVKKPSIVLQRYPYEEPHHLNLVLIASNDTFSGSLEYYCNADDLKEIGNTLKHFPKQVPDKYVYKLGSQAKEDNFAFFLELNAFTTDSAGHCALSVAINNNQQGPDSAACHFCMRTEASAINHLGNLLIQFGKLQHFELVWETSGEGELNEKIQRRED